MGAEWRSSTPPTQLTVAAQQPVQAAAGQDATQYAERVRQQGHRVTQFSPWTFQRVAQFGQNGFRRQRQALGNTGVMHRFVALRLIDVLGEVGGDGAGLNQADLNAGTVQLHTQSIGPGFQRKLAGA